MGYDKKKEQMKMIEYKVELDRVTNILVTLLNNGGHSRGIIRAVLSDFLYEDYMKLMSGIFKRSIGQTNEMIFDYYDYQVGNMQYDKPDWLKD